MARPLFQLRAALFRQQSRSGESARRSLIEKREHQLAFGHDRVVYYTTAMRPGNPIAAGLCQFGMNEKSVAGKNGLAEFYFVRAHEIADPTSVLRQLPQKNASELC